MTNYKHDVLLAHPTSGPCKIENVSGETPP